MRAESAPQVEAKGPTGAGPLEPADASRRNRVSVFCPGKGAPEVAKEAGSWENQLGQVRVWLKSLSEVRR